METSEEFFLFGTDSKSPEYVYCIPSISIYIYVPTESHRRKHRWKETRRNLQKVFQTPKNNWKQKGHQQTSVCFSLCIPAFLTRIHVFFLVNLSFLVESMCFVLKIPVFFGWLWNPRTGNQVRLTNNRPLPAARSGVCVPSALPPCICAPISCDLTKLNGCTAEI